MHLILYQVAMASFSVQKQIAHEVLCILQALQDYYIIVIAITWPGDDKLLAVMYEMYIIM